MYQNVLLVNLCMVSCHFPENQKGEIAYIKVIKPKNGTVPNSLIMWSLYWFHKCRMELSFIDESFLHMMPVISQ